jgi:hypothetical protein
MSIRRLTCLLALMILSRASAPAQGNLLPPGESGWGVSGGLGASRNVTTYGFATGYTIDGRLDLGISVGRVNRNPDGTAIVSSTLHGTYLSPQITLYVVRQDSIDSESSIALTAGYEHVSFREPFVLSEESYSGAVSFFEDVLKSSSPIKLQPYFSIAEVKTDTFQTLATMGLFFGFTDAVGKIAGLSVAVGYQSGTVTGAFQLSIVF